MTAFIPRLAQRLFGTGDAAPTDPAAINSVAAGTPVLSLSGISLANHSPDQAHEILYALSRADD
jgi:hypothetical protein